MPKLNENECNVSSLRSSSRRILPVEVNDTEDNHVVVEVKKKNNKVNKKRMKKPEKIMQMRKNYSDALAIFFYMMNCSLVHLALFITCFFIRRPDLEQARKADAMTTLIPDLHNSKVKQNE